MDRMEIREALEEAQGAIQASNSVYSQLADGREYLLKFIDINNGVLGKLAKAIASLNDGQG